MLLLLLLFLQCIPRGCGLSLGSHDINAKYTTVRSSVVNQKYQVKSMIPAGYLSRLPRSGGANRDEQIRIKEIVYIPSLLNTWGEDSVRNAEDDEHFLSVLVEKGYRVHMLTNSDPYVDYIDALESMVSWLSRTVPPRSLALCASELACPSLLRYVTIALQMGPARADLGALCLIQPPPLQSLSHDMGRRSILQRYLHLDARNIAEDVGKEYGPAIYDILHSRKPMDSPEAPSTEASEEDAEKKKKLEEAKLRAEIEMLEWQSSAEYKGKDKKMRNLKSKRSKLEKMLYDKQRALDPTDLINMRLERLRRQPLTLSSVCEGVEAPPYLHRARDVGKAMKDRILVICTDSGESAEPLLGISASDAKEITPPFYEPNASIESLFEMMVQDPTDKADLWGRAACEEAARLFNNEPIICLEDIAEEEFEDKDEDEGGQEMLRLPLRAQRKSETGAQTLWGPEAERRHAMLAEVLDQWIVGLTSFGHL